MEVSVARFKPLWSVGCREQHGLLFQMLSVVQTISKSAISPHAEEIIIINLRSGRGIKYLSASKDSDDQRGVPVTERGVDMKCKKKIKKKKIHFQGSKSSLIHPPCGLEMNCKRKKKCLTPHQFLASLRQTKKKNNFFPQKR